MVLLLELITGGELFHWTPSGEVEAAHVVCTYIMINKYLLWNNLYLFQGASSFDGT